MTHATSPIRPGKQVAIVYHPHARSSVRLRQVCRLLRGEGCGITLNEQRHIEPRYVFVLGPIKGAVIDLMRELVWLAPVYALLERGREVRLTAQIACDTLGIDAQRYGMHAIRMAELARSLIRCARL